MKSLKKILLVALMFLSSYSSRIISSNDTKISNLKQTLTTNCENDLKIDFEIIMDSKIFCGDSAEIKILVTSPEDLELNKLNLSINFDNEIFKFKKKDFLFKDLFKIKSHKTNDSSKELEFILKSRKHIKLIKDQTKEILNIKLKSKSNISGGESTINFKIDANESNVSKILSKQILILKNKIEIENIKIKNQKNNYVLEFKKDITDYNITVPNNETHLEFEITKNMYGKQITEYLSKELNKTKNTTKIKLGDYVIKINKEKNSKARNELKNILKKIKAKKKVNTLKNNKQTNFSDILNRTNKPSMKIEKKLEEHLDHIDKKEKNEPKFPEDTKTKSHLHMKRIIKISAIALIIIIICMLKVINKRKKNTKE